MFRVELNFSCIFFDYSESNRLWHDSLLRIRLAVKFVNGFKLEIECKFCLVEVLWMNLVGIKDSEKQVVQRNVNFLTINFVEEEGRLKTESVNFDEFHCIRRNWLKDGSQSVGHWRVLHGYLVSFDSNNYKFERIL